MRASKGLVDEFGARVLDWSGAERNVQERPAGNGEERKIGSREHGGERAGQDIRQQMLERVVEAVDRGPQPLENDDRVEQEQIRELQERAGERNLRRAGEGWSLRPGDAQQGVAQLLVHESARRSRGVAGGKRCGEDRPLDAVDGPERVDVEGDGLDQNRENDGAKVEHLFVVHSADGVGEGIERSPSLG